MPVTEGRLLDKLAEAVQRYKQEGTRGTDWTYDHMSAEERLAFDLFLVRVGDELAYQAGSPESRFRERVRRMAEAG